MTLQLRLVLDTNVVLDLLLFCDASVTPIRHAIEQRHARCFATPDTLAELSRVLAYPEFELSSTAQTDLLNQYQTWLDQAPGVAHVQAKLPRCSDPDDQMFIELASAAAVDFLITKDKALLALGQHVRDFKILTPNAVAGLL